MLKSNVFSLIDNSSILENTSFSFGSISSSPESICSYLFFDLLSPPFSALFSSLLFFLPFAHYSLSSPPSIFSFFSYSSSCSCSFSCSYPSSFVSLYSTIFLLVLSLILPAPFPSIAPFSPPSLSLCSKLPFWKSNLLSYENSQPDLLLFDMQLHGYMFVSYLTDTFLFSWTSRIMDGSLRSFLFRKKIVQVFVHGPT